MTDDEARAKAKAQYESAECEFDADARVIHLDEEGPVQGAAWVQAWLFVEPPEEDE